MKGEPVVVGKNIALATRYGDPAETNNKMFETEAFSTVAGGTSMKQKEGERSAKTDKEGLPDI